jgi:cell division protein FtsQ
MNPAMPAPLDVKLMNMTASVLFTGCALLLLAAGAWWVLRHPGFSITRIVVQGELVHNSALTLRAHVLPQLSGNFFTVDLQAARAAFEEVPWVRRATVRREFPGSLRVSLQEHEAVALWGSRSGTTLLNNFGEVFEASTGDMEQEAMPRLRGPQEKSAEVLRMYQALQPVMAKAGLALAQLELTGRGSWRATLDTDTVIELGSGTPTELEQRVQRFAVTLEQVAAHYGRKTDALQSADLRHEGGYAIKLKGVTTLAPDVANTPAPVRRRP